MAGKEARLRIDCELQVFVSLLQLELPGLVCYPPSGTGFYSIFLC